MSATRNCPIDHRQHEVEAIIHFAGSIVVPDSIADPLGYYHNNTVKSPALMEVAIATGVKNFNFSSTAAGYGMPQQNPLSEDAEFKPISPYGSSKLMTEIMLADGARAHDFRYVSLRYFNVAGADPKGRSGQSTRAPRISSRSPRRRHSASGATSRFSARTIRRPMAPAFATTSTSRSGPRALSRAPSPSRRWPLRRVQLRLFKGLLRVRSHRRGQAGLAAPTSRCVCCHAGRATPRPARSAGHWFLGMTISMGSSRTRCPGRST
jgi:hypothetical protein